MKGIILKDYQIKALQANGSIQVRVVMRVQPPDSMHEDLRIVLPGYDKHDGMNFWGDEHGKNNDPKYFNIPLGKVGREVFVKETWGIINDKYFRQCFKSDPQWPEGRARTGLVHKRWRSAMHMKEYMSRFTLELTSIRVERLQDITLADIQASGLFASLAQDPTDMADELRDKFTDVWISHAKPGEKWADNPWVWVYDLKPVEG